MTITDEAVKERVRSQPHCDYCQGKFPPGTLQATHVIARGRDNGSRLDVWENMLAGCHRCHRQAHDGNIPAWCVWAVAAAKHGTTIGDLQSKLYALLRTPKPLEAAT